VEPAPTPEHALLAPLAPEPTVTPPTPPKRTSVRKRSSSRNLSILQREWTRTRTSWKALTKVYGCESLDFLCTRYEDVEAEVAGMGDVEDAALLAKVKALHRDILKRKNDS
jgi:serine/threonine-protein kinase